MEIWVTRQTAFGIQCGGLERLQVWFRKPVWVEEWKDQASYNLPFGHESELNGARIAKWEVREGGSCWIETPISFGKLFGYDDRKEESENEIARFVWSKLEEHFGNSDFDQWHEYEKEHPECHMRNFLLEIDLNVKIKLQ